MARVWIRTGVTASGDNRYRVEFRPGGREERARFGGSFATKRLARIRAAWIEGELAAGRLPDLNLGATQPKPALVFEQAAHAWRDSRLDIAASTREQHRIQLDKLLPLMGTRPVSELEAADFAAAVVTLHG